MDTRAVRLRLSLGFGGQADEFLGRGVPVGEHVAGKAAAGAFGVDGEEGPEALLRLFGNGGKVFCFKEFWVIAKVLDE